MSDDDETKNAKSGAPASDIKLRVIVAVIVLAALSALVYKQAF